jgi:lactate dehydrogenase-like 2-hydroxyacid dehydrogenase
MTADTSLPDDEDVEDFADLAGTLLADVEDPEAVYDALREGNIEGAFDRIDAEREDTEATLTDLYELAVAIAERNPEAIEALRDDVDSFRPRAKPPE